MLTIGIHYLNGYVSASFGRHDLVEWPPHPGRLFMAMVAAHYETGAEAGERDALLWLERQPPPEVHAGEFCPRAVVTQYVPVNDKPDQFKKDQGKTKFFQEVQGTDFRRNRQPRVFPRAWLPEAQTYLSWPQAEPPPEIRDALEGLCGKVARLGHSASQVQVWVAEGPQDGLSRWRPDDSLAHRHLRVPVEGTLKALEEDFAVRTARARNARDESASRSAAGGRRPMAEFGYTRASCDSRPDRALGSVFGPHLDVFSLNRDSGPLSRLDLPTTLALVEAWRGTLDRAAGELGASEEATCQISGKASGGAPLQRPHVACFPLAFVGRPHADGCLRGVAMALPGADDLPAPVRAEIRRAAARACRSPLDLGPLGVWRLQPVAFDRPPLTLRTDAWTGGPSGAAKWSTVTPFAFDRHPKGKTKSQHLAEVEAVIRLACKNACLPQPREVVPTPVSAHLGVPHGRDFPRLRRKDGSERGHIHAILVFDEPVIGPVLLGAGRYRGYGLFRPIADHFD